MEFFLISAAVGLIVGVLSGLLGIGGGTIIVPTFRLGFGMSAIQATATSLFTIVPTSLVGCIKHIRNHTCNVTVGFAAGLAGACTSPLGVYLASLSPSWTIMLVAAMIIGYSAFNMFRRAFRPKKTGLRKQETEPLSAKRQAFTGAAIGLGAGIASGYVGVGGGFIMVPLFITLVGLPMVESSGTSLIAVTILAIPGAITQIMLGNVDIVAGIAMAVGSIPGAYLGAMMVKRVPEKVLTVLFGCILMVAAVALVLNEVA